MIDKTKLTKAIKNKYSFKDETFFAVPKSDWKDKIEVEVGDSKQPDFKPQVKHQRWDNECNVSYRLIHDELTPTVETVDNKIVWKGKDIEAHFYDLIEGEGGYEMEVVLNKKPKTNVVSFSLNDKDVEYFYQPALTQKEIAEGSSRPENVEGSYAIYAKTPKKNYKGGKEYKTGKVGHIFRPRIEDANGDWVWGSLLIENGILSVTIPQSFLDTAKYPVKHAAGLTFGYETAGASTFTATNTQTKVANMVDAYTASTGDVITQFSYYGNSISGTNNLYITPYTVVSGSPSVPVDATGLLISLSTTPSWQSSATGSLSLTDAVKYCTVTRFNSCAVNTQMRYDEGSAPGRLNSSSTTFTNPFAVSGTDSGRHYSWYATYTTSGTVYTLTASVTSFSVTGQNALFTRSTNLTTAVTSFSVTGVNAILSYNRTLVASVTTFAVTGVNAILSRGMRLTTSVTAFSVTGVDALLSYGRRLVASVASFTVTDINALFSYTRTLVASVTTFTATGQDAILTYSAGGTVYTLTATVTSFTATTVQAGLSHVRRMIGSVSAFSVTTVDASLSFTRRMIASVTAFSVTGIDAIFSRSINLVAQVTNYTVTGINAVLTYVDGSITYPLQIIIANTGKVAVWTGSGNKYIQVN